MNNVSEPYRLTSEFWTFTIKHITTEYWSCISKKVTWVLNVLQRHIVSMQLWTPDLLGQGFFIWHFKMV